MKTLFICLLWAGIFSSCSKAPGKEQENKITFTTRHISIPTDTTIQDIAYKDGFLILLQTNGKFQVLDSAYRRVDSLERKLNTVSSELLEPSGDSLFIGDRKHPYFIGPHFEPLPYKSTPIFGGLSYFLAEDSMYFIYGGCVGEWGGSVFFRNKKTGELFSHEATCPHEVLRFKGQYVICSALSHLSEITSYLFVTYPEALYQLPDSTAHEINWFYRYDDVSIVPNRIAESGKRSFYVRDVMPLITFPYGDSLYSILSLPEATGIAVIREDTVAVVDTLVDQKLYFHTAKVIQAGEKRVSLYKLTSGSAFAAYSVRGNYTGLIVVHQNRIDFLDPVYGKE